MSMNKPKLGEGTTPGPWTLRLNKQNFREEWAQFSIEVSGEGIRSVIAQGYDASLCPEHGGSMEANARLIAKAPLLVEAVDMLVELLPYAETAMEDQGYKPGKVRAVTERVRALLAKLEED